MADYAIVKQAQVPTIGIRRTVPMAEMQQFFDDAFSRLSHEIESAGLTTAGAPYGRYRGMPTDTYDVEAGVQLTESVAGHGEFVTGSLPEIEAVEFMHIGPYDRLRQSYESIATWMAENDIIPGAEMWEIYLSDPMEEPDSSKWETKIVWPVVR